MLINEIFRSIQGEGVLIGLPTVFIRTSGCNLDCAWCDTRYAQENGNELSIDDTLSIVESFETKQICLTGGEPLLQKGSIELIRAFMDLGHMVSVETNGSISLEGMPWDDRLMISMDCKCPSSGMADKMCWENMDWLRPMDQLKFVVADERDMLYAKKVLAGHPMECNVVLSPVGGLELSPLVDFILRERIDARVLPQLHKLIWGDARGV